MKKPRVLITGHINEEVIPALGDFCEIQQWTQSSVMPKEEILREIPQADAVIVAYHSVIDKDIIRAAKHVKIIVQAFVGYDTVDVPACTEAGIPFCNTGNQSIASVSELAMALILSSARHIPASVDFVKSGTWKNGKWPGTFGFELYGKTMGVLGMGHIGKAIATKAKVFGMDVLYHNRHPRADVAHDLARYVTEEELLSRSDIVVNALPLTKETKYSIQKETFKRMKKTSLFVNVGRGNTVVTADLVAALQNGEIGGAALDVMDPEPLPPEHPLLTLKNVVITPHIGGNTPEAWQHKGVTTATNIKHFFTGGELIDCINPQVLHK